MKAIVLLKPQKPELKELEDLVLNRDNWVKIGVRAVGLCGSDMQKINSVLDPSAYLKTQILGHEFSGEILETGSEVEELSIGERVTASPLIPCDSCPSCEKGHSQLCEDIESIGRTLPGAFSEQVLVPAKNVRRLSNDTIYEQACLSDVVAVAVHNYHLAGSPKGKRILILGDGAVGLSCLQVCGQENNVDIVGKHHRHKVELLNGRYIDVSSLGDIPDSSYDIILESVGRQQDGTLAESIRLIRPQGRIVVAGVYESGYMGQLLFRDLFYKEALLQGSNSYGIWNGKSEFDIALEMIEKGKINVSEMITHILPLNQFSEGVRLMNEKSKSGAVKIVYKP
ncbi:MAG: alcohol dehydrogenase catalytic domain-containing protein [Candidatus Thorarchaeota archaeon]